MKVFITLLILIFATNILRGFSGEGSGTPDDPYRITTVEQLQEMNDDLAAHYILMNDIDASETRDWNDGDGFIGIGKVSSYEPGTLIEPFTGELDGNNKTISNICVNMKQGNTSAFFNYAGDGFHIHDLRIIDMEVGTKCEISMDFTTVALMFGSISNKNTDEINIIENCEVSGLLSEGYQYFGGFCAVASNSIIRNCKCEIKNERIANAGGFCKLNGGVIENCVAIVNFSGNWSGGFCNRNHGTIRNCESNGKMDYFDNSGGFCFINHGIIDSCSADFHVHNAHCFGGFCYENSNKIINSYSSCIVDSANSDYYDSNVALFCYCNGTSNNYADSSIISHCRAEGSITGYSGLYGFCCFNGQIESDQNHISECYCTGEITGHKNISGFCGGMNMEPGYNSSIVNCYSRINLKADSSAFGFCGFINSEYTDNQIKNCYWAGEMDCSAEISGFNGKYYGDTNRIWITSCFWDNELSGVNISENATGLPTADMKDINTFLEAGWDFENVWAIDPEINDGYPYLQEKTVVIEIPSISDEDINVRENSSGEWIVTSDIQDLTFRSLKLLDKNENFIEKYVADSDNKSISIPLIKILPGIYILRISTNRGIVKKIVIRR